MSYWKDVWRFINSIEYEFKFAGKYGGKGEKRQEKKKATPEQIKEQNRRNKEKKVRRLLKANFFPGDLWAALTYPEGTRKPLGEIMKDFKKFARKLRTAYKKMGKQLKYIYRIEIGRHGGIHIHIVLNRIKGGDTDLLVQESWRCGHVNFKSIRGTGGYERLACYIVKQPEEESEEYEQLSLFPKKEQKVLTKYSCSKNLVRPKPERKEYRRWTVKKLVEDGPKPTPGFYIDKESIHTGINPYTGMSYYYYTEIRIKEIKAGDVPEMESG